MSICSIRSSNLMPGLAAVSTNGYRLTTTRSTRPMPCCFGKLEIVGMIAAREDAAVDFRMERLDAAVHHFGEAGHVADVDHRQARIGQRLRGSAGRDQLEAARRRGPAQTESGRSCQKHSESHAASNECPRENERNTKTQRYGSVFGIDTKCNGPVSSPQSISADQKAASCGLFLLPQAHPAMGRGSITKVASSHQ